MSPATILLIAANLLPLAGVFFWGWNVFVLLILYWLETLVIAFWAVVKMLLPPDGPSPATATGAAAGFFGRMFLAAFTVVHAGIFMGVHFVFLWVLFSGQWMDRVQNPAEFWDQLVIGTDLWAPLLFLFLVRGWQTFSIRIRRRLGFLPPDVREVDAAFPPKGLYTRIIVMQFTIIFGGWIAMGFGGGVGALVLLIGFKTLFEVFFDPMEPKTKDQPTLAGGQR